MSRRVRPIDPSACVFRRLSEDPTAKPRSHRLPHQSPNPGSHRPRAIAPAAPAGPQTVGHRTRAGVYVLRIRAGLRAGGFIPPAACVGCAVCLERRGLRFGELRGDKPPGSYVFRIHANVRLLSSFGLRTSLDIRHSSFVIPPPIRRATDNLPVARGPLQLRVFAASR